MKLTTKDCVFQINDQVPEGMSSLFSDPVLSKPNRDKDESTPVVSSSLLKLSNSCDRNFSTRHSAVKNLLEEQAITKLFFIQEG